MRLKKERNKEIIRLRKIKDKEGEPKYSYNDIARRMGVSKQVVIQVIKRGY